MQTLARRICVRLTKKQLTDVWKDGGITESKEYAKEQGRESTQNIAENINKNKNIQRIVLIFYIVN